MIISVAFFGEHISVGIKLLSTAFFGEDKRSVNSDLVVEISVFELSSGGSSFLYSTGTSSLIVLSSRFTENSCSYDSSGFSLLVSIFVSILATEVDAVV